MSTKFNYIYVVLDITDADKEVPIARALLVDAVLLTCFKTK